MPSWWIINNMPLLTLNLFKLLPDKLSLTAFHLKDYNTQIIRRFKDENLLVTSISSQYEGEEPGIYIIVTKSEFNKIHEKIAKLVHQDVNITEIKSRSILMKYLITDILKKRIFELQSNNKVYLRYAWNSYGKIVFCSANPLFKSRPYDLFSLWNCYEIRIEHLDDALYLQLDIKNRHSTDLQLDKIVTILDQRGISYDKLSGLECNVYTAKDKRVQGYITHIPSLSSICVHTQKGNITADYKSVSLNSNFMDVKYFINNTINENLPEFDGQVRRYVKYPLDTLRTIQDNIVKINKMLFPIQIADVIYELDETAKQFEFTGVVESLEF